MKVLVLPLWYPTPGHPYAGIFVREHARAARAAGVELAVLHIPGEPRHGGWLWRIEEERDPEISAGFPTFRVRARSIRIPGSPRLSYWISYGLGLLAAAVAFRRLRSRGFKPDVIHAHVSDAGAIGVALGKLFGTPVVITEHSTAFPTRTLDSGQLKRARWAFRHAVRVLPVSISLQQAIEAYGIDARFEVVPNAVDLSVFHPRGPEERTGAKRTGSDGRKRMAFVGSLEPTEHKGFPTLVEALRLLGLRRSDWSLDVVGDGPSRVACEHLVEQVGQSRSVIFHGGLPRQAVARLMRESDLFVLPSRFETQGCVLIEAMASGLPIVSTNVGGIPETVASGYAVLVQPGDAPALADAIDRALSNLGAFDRVAMVDRTAARFGLEAVGATLARIYGEVEYEHREPAAGDRRPLR
jgi:L-malate glycosyltransferase